MKSESRSQMLAYLDLLASTVLGLGRRELCGDIRAQMMAIAVDRIQSAKQSDLLDMLRTRTITLEPKP